VILTGPATPITSLENLDPAKLKDATRKRLDRAGLGDNLILGVIEVSGNVTKSETTWMPHAHLVIAGDNEKLIKKRLKKRFPKQKGVPRPVVVKPIYDLLGWLSYIVKPYMEARIGYQGTNGRAQTTDRTLVDQAQREALLFMDRFPLWDRLILRNVRRAGSRFVAQGDGP
jgi:hypothetical protein